MDLSQKLKFPDLKFIKSYPRHPNPKDKEEFQTYAWDIFDIDNFGFCRIVYNEDDNNKIFLDMMCGGYCDRWVPKGFNKEYPATVKGYKELQEAAQDFIDKLIDEIYNSNDFNTGYWE